MLKRAARFVEVAIEVEGSLEKVKEALWTVKRLREDEKGPL